MTQSGIRFEFDNGRFPARFAFLSVLMMLVAIGFSHGPGWLHTVHISEFISYTLLVGGFVLISLLLLWACSGWIATLPVSLSFICSWLLVVAVALSLYLLLIFYHERWNLQLWGIDGSFLSPQAGQALFIMAIVFTPVLLWMEKKLYAEKASQRESESRQFSNLDFRIRPHFLFNTLNSVAGLISIHPKRAETALFNLADVFRVVMADKRQLVPLKAELDLADKYLFLEKTRLGERLKVSSRVDPDAVGIKVPVLLLQPLLENAVYHGIETRFKGGTISINIQIIDSVLTIRVANPLPEAGINRRSGNKVAQQNLRDRITSAFGPDATFDTYEAENSYNVIVRLPL